MSDTLSTGALVRAAARAGVLTGPTSGLAPGFVQTNLVAVPRETAFDVLLFCVRNPAPCPLIEVLEPGVVEPSCAAGGDVRTDLPRYRVWRGGDLTEQRGVLDVWRDDLVTFLLGCSFSFEAALARAGVHAGGSGGNVAMYRTSRAAVPAGRLRGPLVVSMRWIPDGEVDRAAQITARYPLAHGAPVHVGDPAALGIADLSRPDYGVAAPPPRGTTPVFWACGVTPQAALAAARLPFAITHAPGHMLVTDLCEEP